MLQNTCLAESPIAVKLDDADTKVGPTNLRTFQGFYSILVKFKDFQGLENDANFFQGFSRIFKYVGTLNLNQVGGVFILFGRL